MPSPSKGRSGLRRGLVPRRVGPAPVAALVAVVFFSSAATAAVRTAEVRRVQAAADDGAGASAALPASGQRPTPPSPGQGPGGGEVATTAPASTAPTTVAAPRPPASATRPAPGGAAAAPARAAAPGAPASSLGPRNPGAVVIPYQPGQTSWEGTSNGILLKVRIEPATPRVGEPVRFLVEASSGDRPCCGVYLLYGDGGTSSWKMEWPGASCDTSVPGATRTEYTHGYNRAGRLEFSFQAATGRCGADNVYGSLHGYLQVAPGQTRSQGPTVPTVKVAEARAPGDPPDPGFLKVWAQGGDDDGYVSRFVVDFGDGTSMESRPGDPMGCRPTTSGWPARSLASFQEPYPSHRYAAQGSYTVTVTVYSTGCDGAEEQQASATMPYVW